MRDNLRILEDEITAMLLLTNEEREYKYGTTLWKEIIREYILRVRHGGDVK